jgi:hypothetical protein
MQFPMPIRPLAPHCFAPFHRLGLGPNALPLPTALASIYAAVHCALSHTAFLLPATLQQNYAMDGWMNEEKMIPPKDRFSFHFTHQ